MRLFVSTGEVSGDLQGALLVKSLYRVAELFNISLQVEGLGGRKMREAGANVLHDTTAIGSVGLWESIPFVLPTWRVQQKAIRYLQANPPSAIILIDYLGPNLTIATYLKKRYPHIPIIWYIAPQFWVWAPLGRDVQQLVRVTDKLLAIFPAEARFYRGLGLDVTYVGHPLVDYLSNPPSREDARARLGITDEEKTIVLLPASRRQELHYLLPVILSASKIIQKEIPKSRFYLPISLPEYKATIEAMVRRYQLDVTLWEGDSLEVLAAADLAITKSGTVNLELALLKIPQVVIYRVNPLTMWIARNLLSFKIPFMSPVNLVAEREVVPEFLQERATVDNILGQARELLFDSTRRTQVMQGYHVVRDALKNDKGDVCEQAAIEILRYLG
ncbi:MAG: lipid-A-disaccharide synthase [Geminocystis sp.]|nr:lipid-A-disaccharide synthase [Geminocystis sp.]MCS7148084.1 lipid-A-disaccharide synthase [Geminocystis sp.]MDW8116436.1 lipid-A-disaccharide synthase [Geminocystis sp.]MDW8462080.1 lipid-A-disaccharide synthase [Geminocystis sp.]